MNARIHHAACIVLGLAVLGTPGCTGGGEAPAKDLASIPDVPACADVAVWDADAAAFEDAVTDTIARLRRERRRCDGGPATGRVPALVLDGALRCAARVHALDMATEGFVGHTGSDDSSPEDRVARTGATMFAVHEALVAGAPTPAAAVDLWLSDPEDCTALTGERFDRLGVGYAADPTEPSSGTLVAVLGRSSPEDTTGTTGAGSTASTGG